MAIIGKIRKRGGLAVAIVAIAILAFIFSDLFTRNRGEGMPTKIASIDGMDININEFNQRSEYAEQQRRNQSQDGKMSQEQVFRTKVDTYQQLVQEKLLNRECSLLGITVGEDELNDMFLGTFISDMARQAFTDPTTGQYSLQTIRQFMSQYDKLPPEQQQAWQELRKNAVEERIQQKYGLIISKSFYMPTPMAKHISDVYDQMADTRCVLLPYESIDDSKIKVTDKDFEKYYDEHKNEFYTAEEVREIEFVKFDVQPSPADIKAINDSVVTIFEELVTTSDEDMESFVSSVSDVKYDGKFYKRNARNLTTYFPDTVISVKSAGSYLTPRQVKNNWVMGKIMQEQLRPDSIKFSILAVFNTNTGSEQIKRTPAQERAVVDSLFAVISKDPKLFEENVSKFSDDPSTKDQFGDQGWFIDGQLEEELFKPMIDCPVNGIFVYNRPDSAGDYIIKVTGKTELHPKIKVAHIVMGIRPSDKTINDARDNATIFLSKANDLKSLQAQAQKENLNINTSVISQLSYQLDGTPYAREVVGWAFGKKVKEGEVAPEVYELQNIDNAQNMFLVVGLKSIHEKGIVPLSVIKENPQIEALVKIDKKAEQLIEKADKALKSEKTIEGLAQKLSISDDKIDTNIYSVDFSTPYYGRYGAEMKVLGTISASKNTGLTKPIKGSQGVYVVSVDKIYKRTAKEDVNAIRQQYEYRINQRMNQVIPILQLNAKIKNNLAQYISK